MKFILAFSVVVFAVRAHACSCGAQTIDKAWQSSSAVFTGKVAAIDKDPTGLWNKAQIQASKVFKGSASTTAATSVRTANVEASCGYSFQVGETYLVWTTENNGQLSTGLCSLTKPLKQASDDLNWLASH